MSVLRYAADETDEWYGLVASKATGLPTGTIYPILARLEDAGLARSRVEARPPGRPPRRYYQLTEPGRELARSEKVQASHPPEEARHKGVLGKWRRARGLTQLQVADRMGISQARVSAIESHALETTELATLGSFLRAIGGHTVVSVEFDDGTPGDTLIRL